MPTQTTATKIPAPFYAAAGAGDLAYQQLRKLPGKVAELRFRAAELGPVMTDAVSDVNLRVDLDRLRDAARRNAEALVTGATTVYDDLVARGEQVVRNVRTTEASVEVAPAAGTVIAQVTTAPEKAANRAATSRAATSRAATSKAAANTPATNKTATNKTATKSATTKRTATRPADTRTADTRTVAAKSAPAKRAARKQ